VKRPNKGLAKAFGSRSAAAKGTASAFAASFDESIRARPSGVVAVLFEAWRKSFGIGSTAARKQDLRRTKIAAWQSKWCGTSLDEDLFLYAVQCFYSSVVKRLAVKIATEGASHEPLRRSPGFHRDLESGAFFQSHGIVNLVNGDVHQTAVHLDDPRLAEALNGLDDSVDAIDVSAIDGRSLRDLYLDLFPREVRHALGEYYTPDWLASHVLDVSGFDPADNGTVLDPMCGAGTFLIEAVNRIRQCGRADEWERVVGIDLHPLAVLSARVAMLAAAVSERRTDDRPTTMPIYHGDAIAEAWRRRADDHRSKLLVQTPLGEKEFDDDVAAAVQLKQHLDRAGVIGDAEALVADARSVRETRAADVVVGNPPWIGWESLPDEVRRSTTPMWQAYGLFAQEGMDAILGGGKKDLSMLAAVASADAWLKPGGVLSFVLAESTFKAVGAARGFRRFHARETPLKVLLVDDMVALNPFANAATRTAVLTLRKGEPTAYPVRCIRWRRDGNEESASSPIDDSDLQSPWLTASSEAMPLLRRMLGKSAVRAYEGVNTGGANGVFWLRILERVGDGEVLVENTPELGKISVPKVRAVIEDRFLHPLLRHQDVGRDSATPSLSILLLQDPVRRTGAPIDELARVAPKTLAYIHRFEPLLRNRASFKRYFQRGESSKSHGPPFYSMFNVGGYTLSPYKTVWRRMIAPVEAAAVIGENGKPPLPQETLCFIPCARESEAAYFAAMMNSRTFNAAALAVSQGSTKSFGAPNLLAMVRIPTFEPASELHLKLGRLTPRDDREFDSLAAKAFGFNEAEAGILADELASQLDRG
jgi:hypothetical protein